MAVAFREVGLEWRDHVEFDATQRRPAEIIVNRGDAAKAHAKLGWKPRYTMPDVVRMMIQAELVLRSN